MLEAQGFIGGFGVELHYGYDKDRNTLRHTD